MDTAIQETLDAARDHVRSGQLAQAEFLCRGLLRERPDLAEGYLSLGVALEAQGRHREAADCFRACLPLLYDPKKYYSLVRKALGLYVTDVEARVGGAGEPFRAGDFPPISAEVEVTAHCQLKCPFCRTGGALRSQYPAVPHGLLSTDTLGTILEQLPSLFLVSLYNWGEPFLHPDLISIIRTAKSFGTICEISTNMQIMTPELADGLIDSGLDFLRISCDGTTQDAYGAYRKQGDLRKVLDHAKLLSERKRERNSKFPIMIFQMVVNRYNEHQADEFPAFAHDNGADVVDVVPLCPMTREGAEVLKDYEPTDERFARFNPVRPLTGCRQPWHHVSFDWNGDVYTCCNPSGMTHLKMGNIKDTAFSEIWSNDKFAYARRLIQTAKLEENDHDLACIEMCYEREFRGGWYAAPAERSGDPS